MRAAFQPEQPGGDSTRQLIIELELTVHPGHASCQPPGDRLGAVRDLAYKALLPVRTASTSPMVRSRPTGSGHRPLRAVTSLVPRRGLMHIGAAARTAVLPDVAARPETPAWRHRPEPYPPGTGRRLRRRPGRRARHRVSPGLPGGSLRLAAPRAGMARVLSATGMHQHLDIYPSVPAAIATWQRRTVAGSAGAGTHARPGDAQPVPVITADLIRDVFHVHAHVSARPGTSQLHCVPYALVGDHGGAPLTGPRPQ
jgi:hypothetical protein